MLLLALIVAIYLPYVLHGRLIRDDLGFVSAPQRFSDYFEFQAHLSSYLTMTARPVSALLHGLCYWFLRSLAWAHHAINISLFTTSILLVHAAISRVLDRRLAFIVCTLAAVYPAASGTVFSAMMMNSNLAAASWAGAFWLASTRTMAIRTAVVVCFLLVVSALSYESFVPLFPAVALAAGMQSGSWSGARALRASWAVVAGVGIVLFYRVALERVLFATAFSRAGVPHDFTARLLSIPLDGTKVAFIDSIRVSAHALRNWGLVSPISMAILAAVLVPVLVMLWRSLSGPYPAWCRVVLLAAACLFLMTHAIFLGSEYRPTANGFESRTQGAIRFGACFLLGSALFLAATSGSWGRAARVGCLAIFLLFALGMVGQREAWIAAGRYNEGVLGEVESALRASGLAERDSLTLVAVLDRKFKESVNGEPTFGTSWDLGPALELVHPNLRVAANVYRAKRARVDSRGLTLDGTWRADFPFYVFRTGAGIRLVGSESEWGEAIR